MRSNAPRVARARPSGVRAFFVLICVMVSAFGAGCEKAYLGPPPDTPQAQLEYARYLLQSERYYDAITELTAYMSENPGSGMLDTAIFYLGEAYMGRRDFAMAAAEYERLLREFPGSGHAAAARYSLGVAYFEQSLPAELDPTMTDRAMEQLLLFLKLHPDNRNVPDAQSKIAILREKKAKKRFLNGRLYLKLKEPKAARFYFESLLGTYPETEWAPKALLGIAKSYEMEKNTAAAVGRYMELLRTFSSSEEAAEARRRLSDLGVDAAEPGVPASAGVDSVGAAEGGRQ